MDYEKRRKGHGNQRIKDFREKQGVKNGNGTGRSKEAGMEHTEERTFGQPSSKMQTKEGRKVRKGVPATFAHQRPYEPKGGAQKENENKELNRGKPKEGSLT